MTKLRRWTNVVSRFAKLTGIKSTSALKIGGYACQYLGYAFISDGISMSDRALAIKDEMRNLFGAGKKEAELAKRQQQTEKDASDERKRQAIYRDNDIRPDTFGDDRLRDR